LVTSSYLKNIFKKSNKVALLHCVCVRMCMHTYVCVCACMHALWHNDCLTKSNLYTHHSVTYRPVIEMMQTFKSFLKINEFFNLSDLAIIWIRRVSNIGYLWKYWYDQSLKLIYTSLRHTKSGLYSKIYLHKLTDTHTHTHARILTNTL